MDNKGIKGQWGNDAGVRSMALATMGATADLYFNVTTEELEGATTTLLNEIKAFSDATGETYDESMWLDVLTEFLNSRDGESKTFTVR